jgi:hypothetical protein
MNAGLPYARRPIGPRRGTIPWASGSGVARVFNQVNGNGPRELQSPSSDERFNAVVREMIDGGARGRQGLGVHHDAWAVRSEPAFA